MARLSPIIGLTSLLLLFIAGLFEPVNVNPGLKVIYCSTIFSCLKMFLKSNVWCSLRLVHLKTAGQTL